MKKSIESLLELEGFIKRSYNRRNRKIREKSDKEYSLSHQSLGYSWKHDKGGFLSYYIVVSKLPSYPNTEIRVRLHEYGHIYLSHFEGIYEELDKSLQNVLTNQRQDIIDLVNKNCGITDGDSLVDRVVKDRSLNHSLHNIAMDMEVNSKVLSLEDIQEMESDLSELNNTLFIKELEKIANKVTNEKRRKKLQDKLNKAKERSGAKNTIKLIHPSRYHTPDGSPFPDNLTYPQYLVLIVQNLDQFVKMLVCASSGKSSSDMNEITSEEISKVLKGNGDSDSSEGLSDLLRHSGLVKDKDDDEDAEDKEGNDEEEDDDENISESDSSQDNKSESSRDSESDPSQNDEPDTGGFKGDGEEKDALSHNGNDDEFNKIIEDHSTTSREEADKRRDLGDYAVKSTSTHSVIGSSIGERNVSKTNDYVDDAIEEAITEQRNRVIKVRNKRDTMRYWNLGINRTLIVPSYKSEVRVDTNVKLVYLIDVSGSMDTRLIDRILSTIAYKMSKINRGLRYDIIAWSTELENHFKNLNPSDEVVKISTGGGTRLSGGIQYFKENYDSSAILIIASDFEDYLEDWAQVLNTMKNYSVWGFNYGTYDQRVDFEWPGNFKLRNFNKRKR